MAKTCMASGGGKSQPGFGRKTKGSASLGKSTGKAFGKSASPAGK